MRLTTTLAAAAIAVSGVAANAGGLSAPAPEMTVAPVIIMDTPAPAGSINSGYVVLGLLAALVAAAGSF